MPKVEVFSAWGFGPDVGINIIRTEEEVKGWKDPHLHCFLDYTPTEARVLAARIIACADLAEANERAYEEYHKQEMAAYDRQMKEQGQDADSKD